MTTIKEYLRDFVKVPLTDSSYQYFSVLIENDELCGAIMLSETTIYKGDSDHEILESEKIKAIIPSFAG